MGTRWTYLWTGHCLGLKSWAVYKVDFFISVVSAAVHDGSTLLFLTAIFANIRQLQGWSFNELLFVWGFAVFSRNLMGSFFDVVSYTHIKIRSGDLDRLLARPQSLLLQIAAETGINIFSLGRALVGAGAMVAVAPSLHLAWWAFLYFPVAVAGAILLLFGLHLGFVCLAFWTHGANTLLGAVLWTNQFGQYPTNILALPLQVLFTWCIPYAMAGFFPAAFLMRGEEYLVYGLVQPFLGMAFFGLSMLVWNRGLRRYESTGT